MVLVLCQLAQMLVFKPMDNKLAAPWLCFQFLNPSLLDGTLRALRQLLIGRHLPSGCIPVFQAPRRGVTIVDFTLTPGWRWLLY